MRPISDALRTKLRLAPAIFAERGFDGTTIEALSEATGVPTSTLYYNFRGKDDILAFILEDWLQRASTTVEAAIAAPGLGSERLRLVVTAQLDAMAMEPETCQVLLSEKGRIDRLPHIAEAVQSTFHRPVAKLMADGAADGSLRPVDLEHATTALYGAVIITGLHHVIRSAAQAPAFDSSEVAEIVMDLVLHGLTAN